ncbi:MAG: MFS transporter [Trueperaceae bacterium]|nr:MFS transporter [Trueperaceae bacterium]
MSDGDRSTSKGLHPFLTLVLIIGLVVSSIGDEIYIAVMMLQLEDLSSSGLVVALFLASQLIPAILLAPLAGQIVDRFETSRVLILTQMLQTVLLFVMSLTQNISLLLAGAFVLGALFSISQPALFALIPELAEKSQVSTKRINAVVEFFSRSAMLIGPIVGSFLLGTLGASAALLIDAATFGVSALSILVVGIRRHPGPHEAGGSFIKESMEGVNVLNRDPLLRELTPIYTLMTFALSLIAVSEIFFVRSVLNGSPIIYGVVSALWGVGLLLGSFLAGRSEEDKYPANPVSLSTLNMGISLLITGFFSKLLVMIPSQIYGGTANGVLNVSMVNLLHTRVSKEVHGRVFSAFGALSRVAVIFGYGLASVFASGQSAVIYQLSGAVMILAGAYGFLRLRNVRLEPAESSN